MALQHRLPVIPVTIIGSDEINRPSNPLAVYPGKVKIVYGDAIEVQNYGTEDLRTLMDQTKSAMLTAFH